MKQKTIQAKKPSAQEEKHQSLKIDPKSNLGLLRPKNEEAEKEKFKYYWENFQTKGKVYNPRFQYTDLQAAQRVLDQMRVVYSSRFKNNAKYVMDEVIRIYGSCNKYKDEVWGKELSKEQVLEVCDKYLEDNKMDVHVFFGNSLVTTMSGNGLSLVSTHNYYKDLRLRSLLDHEIGTHYTRTYN